MTERSWQQVSAVLALQNGLPFPQHFYRAEAIGGIENDALYISTQLKRLTFQQRIKACYAYDEVYLEQGRYEANTRLRQFADRCEKGR